jgi:hypothetical protein
VANQSCWYRNSDPETMFRWLFGTQTVWILLACIGEVVAFFTIVGYLIAYEVRLVFSAGSCDQLAFTDSSNHATIVPTLN